MVKTLVCGVKTITWGAGSCRGNMQVYFITKSLAVLAVSKTPRTTILVKKLMCPVRDFLSLCFLVNQCIYSKIGSSHSPIQC